MQACFTCDVEASQAVFRLVCRAADSGYVRPECVCVFCWRALCLCVLQQWFTATMNLLGTWLTERMEQQLHVYQLKILIRIAKVTQ